MTASRLAAAIVRLYPIAWRARYEREVLALIEDSGGTIASAANLLGGAFVEWARVLLAGDAIVTLLQPAWAKAAFRFGVFSLSLGIGAVLCRVVASQLLAVTHHEVPMPVAIIAIALLPVQLWGTFRLQGNLPTNESTPKHRIGRRELLLWTIVFLVAGVGQKMQQLTTHGWPGPGAGGYIREFSLLFGFSSLAFMALVPHLIDPWFHRVTGQHIFGPMRRAPKVPLRPLGLD